MRSLLLIPLVAAASMARADTTMYTPFVELGMVDMSCRNFAEVPATSRTLGPSFDAAISTANCLVTTRTRGLRLEPSPASVAALDEAVAPAIHILDRVIQYGDTEHALIAQYAKADILTGNVARMLNALPALSPQMSRKEVTERSRMVSAVDSLTLPWRQRALECRRQIARLAYLDPEIVVRNPLIAGMVSETRMGKAAGVAAR